MTRNKEEYEILQREARNNAVNKTPIDMGRELSSRVGAIFSNFDDGPQNIARYEIEIENDIVKSLALAKHLIYRLETAERHVAMVSQLENQKQHLDKPEKFGGKKTVDNEDSYEEKQEMKHHKKIGKEKRKAEKKLDREIDAKALLITNLILEDQDVDRATNIHLNFCYGDSVTSMALYRKVEWAIYNRLGGEPTSKLAYQIYKNRVRNEWAIRKADEAARVEDAKNTAEETITVEEKEPTTQELFEKMIKAGPLSAEEAKRRGDITLYNHIYDLFVSSVNDAKNFNEGNLMLHPETIQIIGYYGLALLELGSTIGRRVGVRHIP